MVTRSSGNPDLDNATVAAIRRVGSCPPIPEEAGRASWVFTAPVLIR
ncbi:MAG: cell envelope integrity protein TolA [Rhizobiaceae bacterium]|nr:cell envelope integrity protein TolA [Rhizobiaceae bacterium]